jgi:hypothetical protein
MASNRLDRQIAIMNLFSAYFNSGDIESLSQLMRENCTNECEVSRFRTEENVRLPSKISGIENIVQYTTLLAEIPDSVIQFEENGRSEDVVLFGYSFTGTRLFRVQFSAAPDGMPQVHKTPLPESSIVSSSTALNFNGLVSLIIGADEKICSVEVRIFSDS